MTTLTELTTDDLTTATIGGTGVFDVLMKSMNTHLDEQFKLGRIKGPEYAEVYLGSLQATLNTGLQFLLSKRKELLEAQRLELEIEIAEQQKLKIQAEVALTNQQVLNLQAEALNIPKQGALLDKQISKLTAEISLTAQEELKIQAEILNLPKQGALLDQQKLNAITENTVLVATECKLRAEYDGIVKNTAKSEQEIQLLLQKTATERAQTQNVSVDADSMIGRQKGLFVAQAAGFTRDAEQKGAKILIDTWSTRRMTDSATVADGTNLLNDTAVGRAVTKLLSGIGA